ncbi:MAG: DUF924 family protein, partial [Geitlerinemataceae cyanobacterium]
MMSHRATDILAFWFGSSDDPNFGKSQKSWFAKDPQFDRTIRSRFLGDYEKAAREELSSWKDAPHSALALILLLDQFSRNLFRGSSRAFATDAQALETAQWAIERQFDRALLPVQRWFVYLPFEHSENIEDQHRSIELFQQLEDDPDSTSTIDYAIRHFQVIEQFGRFPHRNAILGRESTP